MACQLKISQGVCGLKKRFDVIVVGAGPAGSSAAMEAALNGVETLLLEEHERVGVPPHCAGILYDPDLRKLDLRLPENVIQTHLKGARIHVSDAATLEWKASFTIVDRPRLDQHLADMAVKSGVELWTNTYAKGVERYNGKVFVEAVQRKSVRKIEALGVVAADGYKSQIRRGLGLPTDLELATCLQYEVEPSPLEDNDVMDIYIGGEYAPGGYAWIVPVSEGSARIGLGVRNVKRSPKHYLDELMKRRCPGFKILKVMGHCVPLSGPLRKTFDDNVLFAGDAAGQVIPSSGAGITSSITCGRIAGSVIAHAVKSGSTASKDLSLYEKGWRKVLGGKFEATLQLKNLLDTLSPDEIEALKDTLKKVDAATLLREGRTVNLAFRLLLKKPSLAKFLPVVYKVKRHGIF